LKYRHYKLSQNSHNYWIKKHRQGTRVFKMEELRKAILALNLSVAQIDLSMTEGNYSVDALIDSFNFMREGLENLRNRIVSDDEIDLLSLKSSVLEATSLLSDKVAASIIAFQFYDRLSQRLHHVSDGLSSLSNIMASEDQIVDEVVWEAFMEKMARHAAMREEHELYELIFTHGLSSEAAIEQMKIQMRERMFASQNNPAAAVDDDDIELF